MDDSSIYENLPEEAEIAFLYLEDRYFRQLSDAERNWNSDDGLPDSYYVEYMGKVLAAKGELQLNILEEWKRPSISNFTHETYLNFRHDVVHYREAIQIRFGKRAKTFSVRLDVNEKRKIHHHITQIRELITELPMDDRKRERLIEKLTAFAEEVDRDRTRLESFAAAFVELAGAIGDAAEAAEPARKWIDSIAKLIWGAKDEELKELPRPPEQKRIEPPKKQIPPPSTKPSYAEELDDEIPF